MGTGLGIVGIAAATMAESGFVEMIDINERAVHLAQENLELNGIRNARAYQSNGFDKVQGTFDLIVSNPPFGQGRK